jgi:Flp pilus assembly pilin Flp
LRRFGRARPGALAVTKAVLSGFTLPGLSILTINRGEIMRFLRNIAGVAGSEFAMLLAIGAAVLVLIGHGESVDVSQFMMGNF